MSAHLLETDAAVHLNNVGVELLVRGCHRQAIETFHDAVKVARSASIPRLLHHGKSSSLAAPDTLEDHDRLVQIEEIMHKSAKRLANPAYTQGGQGKAMNVTVISDDQEPVLIAFETPSSATNYLIRIKTVEDGSTTTEDLAVQAAIILYNYGISYESLAEYTSVTTQTHLQLGAFQMFRLAFANLLHLGYERNKVEGMSASQRSLLILFLILGQLIRVTRLLNMCSASEQYMVQLNDFRNAVQGLDNMEQKVTMQHARAA